MTKGIVLIIGSNATRIGVQGGGSHEIGQYLNETVVPAMALVDAGYRVVLATPDGTRPHIDPASNTVDHFHGDEGAYARARDYWERDPAMVNVRTLRSVIADGLDSYAGFFVPGGHAPVVDLMQDPDLGEILRHAHARAKPTALLCHGPVAVVAAMQNAGDFRAALVAGDLARAQELAEGWTYAGYAMTVFSASEERVVEDNILHAKLYFDMPQALTAAGGVVRTTDVNFAPNVVVDRELITGQNPSSDRPLAEALVTALDKTLVLI